jgi:hypothetical protein
MPASYQVLICRRRLDNLQMRRTKSRSFARLDLEHYPQFVTDCIPAEPAR